MKSQPPAVEPTISQDRTRGSEFHTTGEQWAALKPSPPTPSGSGVRADDYEIQRLLLEQQKTSMFRLAREPQDHVGSAMASPVVVGSQGSGRRRLHNGSSGMASWESAVSQSLAHAQAAPPSADEISRIADCLGIPEHSAFSMDAMRSYISELRSQTAVPEVPKAPRPMTIHRVFEGAGGAHRSYLDPPQWVEGDAGKLDILVGVSPVSNVRAYIAKHPEVCFIVLRDYEGTASDADDEETDANGNLKVKHRSESIIPVEKHLVSALKRFSAFPTGRYGASVDDASGTQLWEFSNDWLEPGAVPSLYSPYLPFYHARGHIIDAFTRTLHDAELRQFQRVADYILREYETEYETVDGLIARSKICHAYLHYLFGPETIVVQGRGAEARGYTCTSWLTETGLSASVSLETAIKLGNAHTGPEHSQPAKHMKNYQVSAWHWDFDGDSVFSKMRLELKLDKINLRDRSEKSICDLDLYPIAHADADTSRRLQTRGEWVWKCREQRMIAYRDAAEGSSHHPGERHMIDMKTYRDLHPLPQSQFSYSNSGGKPSAFSPKELESDDPPDNTFVYLAPLSMRGFNLKTKKWVDLQIDRFSEVEWNTGAFESLVLGGKTKRLIQALISNQIEADKSTDIISGKGNGIIMLLHGGPGTGKTLTAESVAEIARKPLYPVTCGDIGTEPRAVEAYLESVLHLGKTWGCVVLLDEADVFLEQRSLEDLKRNALVSVFLRVLEYYDGILILTSNRVGTFDEAFKSRIQLAIHYTSLTAHQRTKIWGNFFSRLKNLNEEGINFSDLEDHIEDLARHKMNGREIRNVITTARQSARWERKQQGQATFMLDYRVMEEIIETSGKFDRYIRELNGGMSWDQVAEEEGLRLKEQGLPVEEA